MSKQEENFDRIHEGDGRMIYEDLGMNNIPVLSSLPLLPGAHPHTHKPTHLLRRLFGNNIKALVAVSGRAPDRSSQISDWTVGNMERMERRKGHFTEAAAR